MFNYSTINEDFDYNDLDIKNPEHNTVGKLTNVAATSDNIKIPLKTLFTHFFKISAPNRPLSAPLNFGLWQGWQNPDNKKPVSHRKILVNDKLSYYDNTNELYTRDNQPTVELINYFSNNDVTRLMNQGFKIMCNMQRSMLAADNYYPEEEITPEITECINDYINYITGQNYDFRNTLYGKQYKESTGNILYYQIFVAPDKGFILVDHIIEYPYNSVSFDNYRNSVISSEPVSISMGALIFTNLKAYSLNKVLNKTLSRIQYKNKEEDFVTEFDRLQNLKSYDASMVVNKWHRIKSYIQHDKTGHIWYSATDSHNMFIEFSCNYDYMEDEIESAVIPEDLTKDLKVFDNNMRNFTGASYETHKKLECIVMNPKIRGYRYNHGGNPGFILYVTNDPEFCEKLLGPGAAEYIRNRCFKFAEIYDESEDDVDYNMDEFDDETYIEFEEPPKNLVKLYSFIWYTDHAMKIYDEYMDNPGSTPKQIKDMYLKENISLYDS